MKRRVGVLVTSVLALAMVAGTTGVTGTAYEGCTPGYWKVSQHHDSWVGAAPNDKFDATFGVTLFGSKSLLEVLWQGGGGVKALGRHIVAGYLNALSSVDYDKKPEQVIFDVKWAAGGNAAVIRFLHGQYEGLNEQYCPLN